MKPASLETVLELSAMQQGVLFHALYVPESPVYLNQSVFTIEGDLDQAALGAAWQRVTDRHQMLRCSFFWDGLSRPVQAVHRRTSFPIVAQDWRGGNPEQQAAALEDFLTADRSRPFDLQRPPQMRLTLLRIGPATHHLIWSRHHILFDGWSQGLILKEVFVLYEAFRRVPDGSFDEESLVGPRIAFERYIRWLDDGARACDEAFWRAELAGIAEAAPIAPAAVQRPAAQQRETGRALPPEISASLDRFARAEGLTVSTLYEAVWAIVLGWLAAREEVVFGLTVAGRPASIPGIERIVGLFINTLPIRATLDGAITFSGFARGMQAQVARVVDHQHTPLVDIQRWSGRPGHRLFDSIIVVGNYPTDFVAQPDESSLRVTAVRSHVQNSLSLTLRVMPGAETRIALLSEDDLDAERAAWTIEAVELLLAAIAGTGAVTLGALRSLLATLDVARVAAALAANTTRLAGLRARPTRLA